MQVIKVFDRPIAFHRSFVTITGSIAAALMLSQAVYWTRRTSDEEGWFYKTGEEWEEEVGLTRTEQESARIRLRSYGYLEEKRAGVPPRLYFRLNIEVIERALEGDIKPLTLDDVLTIYKKVLSALSRGAMLRAKKLGVEAEHVDYAEVLKSHGMTCHICNQAIIRGPGQNSDEMAFDHVHALNAGGTHTKGNVKPSHVRCNARKSDLDIEDCSSLPTEKSICLSTEKLNSLSTAKSKPVPTEKSICLSTERQIPCGQTNKTVYPQANNIGTETTAEITAETRAGDRARAEEPAPLKKPLREEPSDPVLAKIERLEAILFEHYRLGPIDRDFERMIRQKTGKLNAMGCTPELLTEFLEQDVRPLRFVDENWQAWAVNRKRAANSPRPTSSKLIGLAPKQTTQASAPMSEEDILEYAEILLYVKSEEGRSPQENEIVRQAEEIRAQHRKAERRYEELAAAEEQPDPPRKSRQ